MMLTQEQIETRAKVLLCAAQAILETPGEELRPMLILEIAGVHHTIPLQMRNERDKEALERGIPLAIQHLKPDAAFMITDGWRKDPNDISKRIGEVITIVCASPIGLTMAASNYTRDEDGKPVFEETEVVSGQGLYSRFFEGAFVEQRQEGRS